MELTQQIGTFEEELKLLKGEIKTILKEIRTAVLTSDNPFAKGGADPAPAPAPPPAPAPAPAPTFKAVDRSGADAEEAEDEDEASDDDMDLSLDDGPGQPPDEMDGPGQPPAALDGPGQPPAALDGPGQPPDAAGPPAEPIPLRPDVEGADEEDEAADPKEQPTALQWDLLTIASLTGWAEESLRALGAKRFQTVLELSCFAGLLTPEVRDVLSGLDEFSEANEADERPINVNECLVVLRQLEAILRGEKITRLPARRRRRIRRAR